MNWIYAGDRAEADRIVAPIRAAATPIKELPGSYAYAKLQNWSDEHMRPTQRVYWKSSYLSEVSDAAIEALLWRGTGDGQTTASAEMILMGGAQARVGEDDTAFSQRGAMWDYLAVDAWDDPAEDEGRIGDVRQAWQAMSPHAMAAAYVNNLGEEGADRIRDAYGHAKYARLQALKDRYDPGNVFHRNQNVRPSATASAGT